VNLYQIAFLRSSFNDHDLREITKGDSSSKRLSTVCVQGNKEIKQRSVQLRNQWGEIKAAGASQVPNGGLRPHFRPFSHLQTAA
jgi:hypothetical protein